MRHLFSAIFITGLLATPAVAIAADRKADLRDARCIAAMSVMSDQKSTKKSDQAFITAAMLYSLGRIEGRNETYNLSELWGEALEDETETTLIARAMTCMEDMAAAVKALEGVGTPE